MTYCTFHVHLSSDRPGISSCCTTVAKYVYDSILAALSITLDLDEITIVECLTVRPAGKGRLQDLEGFRNESCPLTMANKTNLVDVYTREHAFDYFPVR